MEAATATNLRGGARCVRARRTLYIGAAVAGIRTALRHTHKWRLTSDTTAAVGLALRLGCCVFFVVAAFPDVNNNNTNNFSKPAMANAQCAAQFGFACVR